MSLRPCKDCGKQVSTRARKCPHCGAQLKLTNLQLFIIGAVAAIILLWLLFDWASKQVPIE